MNYLALTDVTVSAADPDHYQISYGAASEVNGVPQVQSRLMPVDQAWSAGFLPAASTSITNEPITIANIPVSPTNPALTAAAIQQAFLATTTSTLVAPWNAQTQMPADSVMPPGAVTMTTYVQVSVVPVTTDPNGLTFDVTFIGATADSVQPALVLTTVTDAAKPANNVAIPAADQDAVIRKQPSNEFRVNPEVPYNPFQIQPDNCSGPAVAMDANGSFVITWAADVSSLASYGSVTDIFARMFEPAGMVSSTDPGLWEVDMNNDGILDTYVQGVRPVVTPIPYNDLLPANIQVPGDVYTFRVNTDTANVQSQPAVAMDDSGNFVIAWASTGQDLSFFNSVNAQQFTHDGRLIGNQVMVNTEDTDEHMDPYVAMSQDGLWLVTWDHFTGLSNDVYAKLYDPQGNVLVPQMLIVNTGMTLPTPTACFDENLPSDTAVRPGHDYIISWSANTDNDNIVYPDGSHNSSGVYFREYSLSADNTALTVIRTDTRANSSISTGGAYIGLNTGSTAVWPNTQNNGQVIMDASGNLTVTYQGFGPDVAQTQVGAASLYNYLLSLPENSDLVADDPDLALGYPFNPPVLGNSGDDDSTIEEVLIDAQANYGLTDSQLGRLDNILNQVATLTRGEANGIMSSQYDADPLLGVVNILNSDTIVNNQRDGNNQRDIITIAKDASSGNFIVRVTNGTTGVYQDISIAPVYMSVSPTLPPVVDPNATATAIQNALNACTNELGINWPTQANGGNYSGPVTVRLLNPDASLTESNPVSPGGEASARGQSNVVNLDITPTGPTTLLTAGITAAATTINVTAATAAAFPTGGPLMIVIDGEHLLVTAGLGTATWTVARGQDGTTAAAHLANANVTLANVTLGEKGWFELEVQDPNASAPLSQNPVDAFTTAIHFDPTDDNSLNQVATDIQTQLRTMGYLTATCTYQLPTNNSNPSEVPPATFITAAITATATTINVDAATAALFPTSTRSRLSSTTSICW